MSEASDKLENFERAFSGGTAGCMRQCNCGVIYYDAVNTFYSWEEGELEGLEQNPNAKGVDYAPGDIHFEGRDYVNACDCWHKRALAIMAFIDRHSFSIADYLSLEKKRKLRDADNSPTVR